MTRARRPERIRKPLATKVNAMANVTPSNRFVIALLRSAARTLNDAGTVSLITPAWLDSHVIVATPAERNTLRALPPLPCGDNE
jgi:hypothetical protein